MGRVEGVQGMQAQWVQGAGSAGGAGRRGWRVLNSGHVGSVFMCRVQYP